MSRFICPYCYGESDTSQCEMKCTYGSVGVQSRCEKAEKDVSGFIQARYRASCRKCTDARKMFFCPKCRKEIPRTFLESSGIPIALVGAKAAGKSNYIGVLVQEILRKMSGSFQCGLNLAANEESNKYYRRYYYDPLFTRGDVIQGTQSGVVIPPMIFPLTFMKKGLFGGMQPDKTTVLTFYDTAGEQFNDTSKMDIYTGYIPNAQGIILLLDPLQVPEIRRLLTARGVSLPAQNTNPEEILDRVVQLIRDTKGYKGKIPISIAVAFTKMDVLENAGLLAPDSILRRESEHLQRGRFVESDFEGLQGEITDIISSWMSASLSMKLSQFASYGLFGLSALGTAPDTKNHLNVQDIAPKRVLDPLLWLLAQKNYIQKVRR